MAQQLAADSAKNKAKPDATPAAPLGFRHRYLFALLGGAFLTLLTLSIYIATLYRLDRLPPPTFTNSLCMDEKLLDFRQHHAADSPSLMVVGSSVAWRHFDGAKIQQAVPGAKPLNAGFCGLRITQTAYVVEWLLRHYPSTQEIVAIVAPQDFQSCNRPEAPVFDTTVAEEFLDPKAWLWSYYFRYFSLNFVLNAMKTKEGREAQYGFEPLFHDAYGSAPIDPVTPAPFHRLFYGPLTDLDSGCFAALHLMAQSITATGRQFVVATSPLHPQWIEQYGNGGSVLRDFNNHIVAALAGTDARYWDGHTAVQFTGAEFTDAIHLHWTAAQRFTEALIAATHLGHEPR